MMQINVVIYIDYIKLDRQCGGRDYRGETRCDPRFICVVTGPFSSLCKCPNRSSWCPGAPGYPTTTTKPPSTTAGQKDSCNFCGVFTTFADVCQNCVFTRDHCRLNCTCQTSTGVAQPISFSLSNYKNQGCLIGMKNGVPVCEAIPPDCSHNYPSSGRRFDYGYAD